MTNGNAIFFEIDFSKCRNKQSGDAIGPENSGLTVVTIPCHIVDLRPLKGTGNMLSKYIQKYYGSFHRF